MLEPQLVRAALLQYAEDQLDEWRSFGAYTNYYNSQGKVYDVPGLGPVTIVAYHTYDSDKNYAGWSEELWIVFEVQGTLYRAKGTYTSYVGDEWEDELTVVKPVEKTIVVFEDE